MKIKLNVYSVCVKPKYTLQDVISLYNQCKENITIPFNFICLTDQNFSYEGIEFINIDHFELDTWWNKVLIFDSISKNNQKNLYLDLDIKILKNIDHLLNFENDLHVVDTPWKNKEYFSQVSSTVKNIEAFLGYGNSSVMLWKKNSRQWLVDMLLDDIFKHTTEHFGDDTFINKYGKVSYIDAKIQRFGDVSKNCEIVINYKPSSLPHNLSP